MDSEAQYKKFIWHDLLNLLINTKIRNPWRTNNLE